jgi:hypothetical protein
MVFEDRLQQLNSRVQTEEVPEMVGPGALQHAQDENRGVQWTLVITYVGAGRHREAG